MKPLVDPKLMSPSSLGLIFNGEQECMFDTNKSVIQSPDVFPVNVSVTPVTLTKLPSFLNNDNVFVVSLKVPATTNVSVIPVTSNVPPLVFVNVIVSVLLSKVPPVTKISETDPVVPVTTLPSTSKPKFMTDVPLPIVLILSVGTKTVLSVDPVKPLPPKITLLDTLSK